MKGNLAIIKLLLAAPAVATHTTRVYPGLAIQGVELPYISVIKESTDPTDVKNNSSSVDIDTVIIQINATSYDTATDIAEAVRTVLDRYTGTVGGIDIGEIRYGGESDFTETEASRIVYVVEQSYRVREKRIPEYIMV